MRPMRKARLGCLLLAVICGCTPFSLFQKEVRCDAPVLSWPAGGLRATWTNCGDKSDRSLVCTKTKYDYPCECFKAGQHNRWYRKLGMPSDPRVITDWANENCDWGRVQW